MWCLLICLGSISIYLLTCIYAACKIEENHVSAEELGKGISQDHQMILNNEMIVYQAWTGLEYQIVLEFCNTGEDELPKFKALQDTAGREVDKMMLTDAPLLFTPGQLALTALRTSNALHKVVDFDSFLSGIFSHKNSTHTMGELLESLDAIDSWVRKYTSPSEKELKHIDRKLKSCWGHDEGKKREKKSKHKSRKSSKEAQNV
ncbi:Cyclin-H1-1, variant 2 [Lathyrus oleraceus]|uniref:Cyclin-H1-1, variant 2 n=1 Tax=Pisum sativum TaxID=3888 RepID=A0A9D4W999_PEA|nr:Cyclin-H1-1, variant 2 [Pisum sativum]